MAMQHQGLVVDSTQHLISVLVTIPILLMAMQLLVQLASVLSLAAAAAAAVAATKVHDWTNQLMGIRFALSHTHCQNGRAKTFDFQTIQDIIFQRMVKNLRRFHRQAY